MAGLSKKLKGALRGGGGGASTTGSSSKASNSPSASTAKPNKESKKLKLKKNGSNFTSNNNDNNSVRNPARRPSSLDETEKMKHNQPCHPKQQQPHAFPPSSTPLPTPTLTSSTQDSASPSNDFSPRRTFTRAKEGHPHQGGGNSAGGGAAAASRGVNNSNNGKSPSRTNNLEKAMSCEIFKEDDQAVRAAAGVARDTPLVVALLKHRRMLVHHRAVSAPKSRYLFEHANDDGSLRNKDNRSSKNIYCYDEDENEAFWHRVRLSLEKLQSTNSGVFVKSYRDSKTHSTSIHDVCCLEHPPVDILKTLVGMCGGAVCMTKVDTNGSIPLHYALTIGRIEKASLQYLMMDVNPSITRAYCSMKLDTSNQMSNLTRNEVSKLYTSPLYRALQLKKPRNVVLLIHQACPSMICHATPITELAADGTTIDPPLLDPNERGRSHHNRRGSNVPASCRSLGDYHDFMEDTPLHLLWRRYHMHKWECDKYFPGDNSTTHIAHHRKTFRLKATETRDTMMQMMHLLNHSSSYLDGSEGKDSKDDATNNGETDIVYNAHWDCMVPVKRHGLSSSDEMTPPPQPQRGFIVHAAASLATKAPLDWLQVIIAKNPAEIGEQDLKGRLPIHYAAMAMGDTISGIGMRSTTSFSLGGGPSGGDGGFAGDDSRGGGGGIGSSVISGTYQGKFILQLLLRLCPSAAQVMDDGGKLPLTLALERCSACAATTASFSSTGSSALVSGLQGLYDAYPSAMANVESCGSVERYKIQMFMQQLHDTTSTSSLSSTDDHRMTLEDEAIFVVQNPYADVHDILGAMWSHKSDAGIQMLTLQTLERMARADSESFGGCHYCDGNHNNDENNNHNHNEPDDQRKGGDGSSRSCGTTSNDYSGSINNVATRIALCGGISAIVHSLNAHAREAVVQEKGCLALEALACGVFGPVKQSGHLTLNDESSGSTEKKKGDSPKRFGRFMSNGDKGNKRGDDPTKGTTDAASMLSLTELSFAAVGAILTPIRAMQDHPKDALVQVAACRALCALAMDADAFTQIVSAGGVTAVVHAMDEHTLDASVQRESLKVLQRLLKYSTPSFPLYGSSSSSRTTTTDGGEGGSTNGGGGNRGTVVSEDLGILIEGAKEQFPEECGSLAKDVLDKLYS